VGRAPAFWTENTVRLIRDYFVAVSVSNFDQNRQDAVGQFVRRSGMQFPGAGGSRWCVSAGGKVLGHDPLQALRLFQTLPEAERAPGAVRVEDQEEIDSKRTAPSPPPAGLILKVYYRAFMRDGTDGLRYVTARDLWHDATGAKTEALPGLPLDRAVTPQAQPDHMWLSEAEWKSLMPAAPRRGESFPVPAAIAGRFFRWHLNPLQVYGESTPLARPAIRAGELKLTVTTVRPNLVRLWLDGFARLGKEATAEVRDGSKACVDQRWGYEPRVLGVLEYDPHTRKFTRFDILALGDHFGRLGICDSAARPGCQPLGISFELVAGDRPADCVPPGRTPLARSYFDSGR
jgi:hypothetical protein